MPITKSASDLQRNINEIYSLCHESREPVYITRHGHADLVVMDADAYEQQARLERAVLDREMRRLASIQSGWADAQAGRLTPLDDVMGSDD